MERLWTGLWGRVKERERERERESESTRSFTMFSGAKGRLSSEGSWGLLLRWGVGGVSG